MRTASRVRRTTSVRYGPEEAIVNEKNERREENKQQKRNKKETLLR